MVNKIKLKLDEYLEFNSDELFDIIDGSRQTKRLLVRVFGGAIRDILANKEIHDVDILVGSQSIGIVKLVLERNGYKYFDSLTNKDISSIYTNINIITEPHTWIKNGKIVQLIKPAASHQLDENGYIDGFINLIQNVDISCCGVSYDGINLYENYPNAVLHSTIHAFKKNKYAKMLTDRYLHREAKLLDRGWTLVDATGVRDKIIDSLLNDKIEELILFNSSKFIKEHCIERELPVIKNNDNDIWY